MCPASAPKGTAIDRASSPANIARRADLANWSRTQAVPADCLCLRKALGLWPIAGPALGPQATSVGDDAGVIKPPVINFSTIQSIVEITATLAFALSGLLAGARKQLDVVGLCIIAGLSAFGGGTLRDVLLDRRPFFWVEHADWLWALMALSFAAMLLLRRRHLALTEKAIQWPDALGLGLFTANGTLIALDLGQPPIVAVLMGVITASFGGVLRDIVCNEIPAAFHDHRPYALCSFVGAWVLVLAVHLQAPQWVAISAAAATAVLLRGLALWTGWTLPAWRINAKR
jgi:uncharacterized membrane protein YeiH